MNPIEKIGQMKHVYRHNPCPTNVAELQAAIQEEWDVITPEEIQALTSTMPQCIAALLELTDGAPDLGFFLPLLSPFVLYAVSFPFNHICTSVIFRCVKS